MLKGEANYWWESQRNLETDAVISWDRFTRLFLDKYFPWFMETQMEIRFLELKQDKMTVAEYEAKFTELSRFMPEFVNTEEKKARRFQLGLKQWIQNRVAVLELTDYATLVQKASIVEVGSSSGERCPNLHEAPDSERPQVRVLARVADNLGHHFIANPAPQYQSAIPDTKKDCPTLKPPASGMSKAASNRPPAARTFNMTVQDAVRNTDMIAGEISRVEIANREIIPVNQVHPECKLKLEGKIFEVDLIPFALGEFDLILGMDWLSSNGAK
ncbi:hypothetical protein AgCh_038679 [Apium graveolens]